LLKLSLLGKALLPVPTTYLCIIYMYVCMYIPVPAERDIVIEGGTRERKKRGGNGGEGGRGEEGRRGGGGGGPAVLEDGYYRCKKKRLDIQGKRLDMQEKRLDMQGKETQHSMKRDLRSW
jgi:hypothetical protein